MRKMVIALLLALLPAAVWASEGGGNFMKPDLDPTDTASLQRGAKLFANYCMGCHSLKYLRYKRMAEDLDIPESVVEDDLIWDGSKIHEHMMSAMPAGKANDWFGKTPPDLSLTVRQRGADWVYTYLNTFYRDDKSSTGVNNLVLPGASMPHVLWRLQGVPEPVYEEVNAGTPDAHLVVTDVKVPEKAGAMSEKEYHEATNDLVNFLAYAAEPIKAERQRLGVWVILFLLVFLGIAYMLKREYWKDVH
jgi:ubiquinol-cytochrome c reductase cytochrome c1 subunit